MSDRPRSTWKWALQCVVALLVSIAALIGVGVNIGWMIIPSDWVGTTGTLVSIKRERHATRSLTEYHRTYTFTDTQSIERTVIVTRWTKGTPGETVPVRYDPTDPDVAHVVSAGEYFRRIFFTLVSGLISTVCILSTVKAINKLRTPRPVEPRNGGQAPA